MYKLRAKDFNIGPFARDVRIFRGVCVADEEVGYIAGQVEGVGRAEGCGGGGEVGALFGGDGGAAEFEVEEGEVGWLGGC